MTDHRGHDYDLGPQLVGHRPYPALRCALQLADPDGYGVEFGVGQGISLRLIAAKLRAVGFDGFSGLPEDWRPGYPRGTYACRPPMVPNALLVVGSFERSLCEPNGFDFAVVSPVALVHFDAALYSSTAIALRYIGPWLQSGTLLVFGQFHSNPYFVAHEQRAWREWVTANQWVSWTVVGHGPGSWVIQID